MIYFSQLLQRIIFQSNLWEQFYIRTDCTQNIVLELCFTIIKIVGDVLTRTNPFRKPCLSSFYAIVAFSFVCLVSNRVFRRSYLISWYTGNIACLNKHAKWIVGENGYEQKQKDTKTKACSVQRIWNACKRMKRSIKIVSLIWLQLLEKCQSLQTNRFH